MLSARHGWASGFSMQVRCTPALGARVVTGRDRDLLEARDRTARPDFLSEMIRVAVVKRIFDIAEVYAFRVTSPDGLGEWFEYRDRELSQAGFDIGQPFHINVDHREGFIVYWQDVAFSGVIVARET